VQISFPDSESSPIPGVAAPKITAAVYIKHQGVLDDPNSHIEMKIKRLMAGSVNGLTYDNVAVISDRSRFTDINLSMTGEPIGGHALQQPYASIWGLMLTKSSLLRFRLIFFAFIAIILGLCAAIGYFVYRFYPLIRKELFKQESPPNEPPMT
jgi:type III secretion protein J